MKLKRAVIAGLFVLAGLIALPASASALQFAPLLSGPLTWPEPDDVVNGIAVADLDDDGDDDIISTGISNRIQVSLSNGDGTGFTPAPGSPFGESSAAIRRFQMVTGNFNADANMDLVVVSRLGDS